MKLLLEKRNGFTLIELLLYVSVSSSVLLLSTFFLGSLLESRIKNQTIAEVYGQGAYVTQVITQAIRNAEEINSPTEGEDEPSLLITVSDAAKDPTVFDIVDGAIRVTEGVGEPIALTSSQVTASFLSFQNLSLAETPGIIRVSFILTHVNVGGRKEYDFSKTFYASASLR